MFRKLYCATLMASKYNEVESTIIAFIALSYEDAYDISIERVEDRYNYGDGYRNHRVNLIEIRSDLIRQVADQ